MQNDISAQESITSQVWAIVNSLPQRDAIIESDARYWVDEVVGKYGDLAIWHAKRAGGFGGSQIGALVKNFCGERADHEQSAHDIVGLTLLRKTPDEPNSHMRRGLAIENNHRKWFYSKYFCSRDTAGFDKLSASVGSKQWMRYSPDDLVMMNMSGIDRHQHGIGRVLVDFKAPSFVSSSDKISFQYMCQLHMGAMVAEHNGLKIDGRLLSQFDWANWRLKDDAVEHSEELEGLISQAGDHYWDFVLRGEVPPFVYKQRVNPDVEKSVSDKIGETVTKIARLKAMISAMEAQVDALEETSKPVLEKVRFSGAKLRLEGMSFTGSPKYDSEKVLNALPESVIAGLPLDAKSTKHYDEKELLAALKKAEIDTKPFIKPSRLQPEALYDALVAHGVDADALVEEQMRGTLASNYKTEGVAWLAREFPDLLAVRDVVESITTDAEVYSASTNDRQGHESSRYAPRSASA